MTISEILGKKYAIEMLMTVCRNPGRSGFEIYGSSRTKFHALMHLNKYGLIVIDEDPRQYNTHLWYPTDKGQIIANYLETINMRLIA